MKTDTFSWFKFLFPALLISVLALGGCGDDGSDGADGADGVDGTDGVDGAPGADGQSGTTVEDLLALNPDFLDDLVALNPQLDLSNTVEYDATSGTVTVHFTLTDGTDDNNVVDVFTDAYELRFYVAELIPNDDGTDTGGQSWNRLIYERGTPASPGSRDTMNFDNLTQDPDTGKYTYIFDNTLAASDNVFRVTARARWRETVSGTRYVFANPVNDNYDFYQSDAGTELASSGADMVATEACESCHGARIGNVGHGGGYTKVKTCNNCHNVNYMATVRDGQGNDGEGDLAFMIHRIHNGGKFTILDSDPDRDPPVPPLDASFMTYPQEIYTCTKCHTEDAPNASLHTEIVTRANCGSCHDHIDFTETNTESPSYHPGGAFDNDLLCDDCHGPGKFAAVADKHNPDLNVGEPGVGIKLENDFPEYEVQITMSDPGDGRTYYIAGETPVVTVKLFDPDTGEEVAGSVYTADQDGQGVEGDQTEGLSVANLFVYGPRANAVPVLTTQSTTDNGNRQGHPLFANLLAVEDNAALGGNDDGWCDNGETCVPGPNPDGRVNPDATGYKYELMNNIGDLQPGTYMVRFEGENYGTVARNDYVTPSTAVITFQVETDVEEPKLSGDACTNCHGDTAMHVQGQYAHNQPFDTDGCLACHDVSENYANYIGNRVHAIHSASITGDLYENTRGDDIGLRRNWSHVHFPRPANNCRTCHTNPAFDDPDSDAIPVWRDPNEVACGGCHGADPTALPAEYTPEFDPADIVEEVAAATHMQEMGGTFDVSSTNPDAPDYVVRQCIVCHGEDRIADLFDTHGLVNFPVTDTSTPED